MPGAGSRDVRFVRDAKLLESKSLRGDLRDSRYLPWRLEQSHQREIFAVSFQEP